MKRLSLILICLATAGICLAQGNRIPWREGTKLNWTDFTGPPDHSSEHDATTRYSFDYNYKWDGNGAITVKISLYFDKNISWKKAGEGLTPELLKHEQIHFDIAELYARKMRKTFAEYTAAHKSGPNTKNEIAKLFSEMSAETQKFQDVYDSETNHSEITEKQMEWNKKVSLMLSELSQYKSN